MLRSRDQSLGGGRRSSHELQEIWSGYVSVCTIAVTVTALVGVAVLQGLLFAIGGYLEGKTSTDAVECYNPRTKRYVPPVFFSIHSDAQ